jgi:uncharacterized membrane protein YbjE (DUF340 family)
MALLALAVAYGVIFLIDLPLILKSTNKGRMVVVYIIIAAAGIIASVLQYFDFPLNPTIIINSIVKAIIPGVIFH